MKSFTKTLITVIIVTFLFYSCVKIPFPTLPPYPADPIIKIVNCDMDSGNLTLSVNGNITDTIVTTRANIVFWEIEADCVKEIVEISMKTKKGNVNVFSKGDPRSMNPNIPSSKWRGKINPRLVLYEGRIKKGKFKREYYKIKWKDNNGIIHTFDPIADIYK